MVLHILEIILNITGIIALIIMSRLFHLEWKSRRKVMKEWF